MKSEDDLAKKLAILLERKAALMEPVDRKRAEIGEQQILARIRLFKLREKQNR